jgi:hypothetical protein
VAIEDAIAALPEHWEDVTARLGEARCQELYDLIEGINGGDHDRVISRIADLLVEGLPPSHPVRRALVAGDLFAPATLDWSVLSEVLHGRTQVAPGRQQRPGETIVRGVAARLLRAPALTENEVRQRGADPADPRLIRLDRPDGGQQWPTFQFSRQDGPLPVVREVNEVLGAAADPLAAADWWLSRNNWLGDQPSRLIGRVPDDYLVRAALVVGSEM